jgi:hypothetical protein
MKLSANMLLVVGMMVGSVCAIGCKSQDKISDKGNDVAAAQTTAATPEDDPAAAPESDKELQAPAGVEKDAYWGHYWAYRAPPAYRYEPVGAYRAGYFWRPGYYGWAGSDYRWYGGAYYPERVGYRYVNPGWYAVGPRWGYRRGYWVRR